MKKLTVITLSMMVVATGLLAGCAKKETPAPSASAGAAASASPSAAASASPAAATGFVPKELKVQFVPSQNAETLEAKAKPLEKLLGDKLGIPVKVSVSTDYNVVIEAMASKQVDVGFLPPSNYVVAHDNRKAADLLAQATRFGVDDATGQPTTELVNFYKSEILVKADSPIKSVADLKGKKMGWQGVTSAAGYVYPGLLLKKAGVDPVKDVTGVQFQGHDKAVIALLNGQVDAVGVFQDIRTNMIKDYPDIFKQTKVLAFSDKIPNDTIAVRSDMDAAWKKKIQDAFLALGTDPEGQKIIFDVYTHKGYVVAKDEDFNIVRDANKEMGLK
ncbi:phosphate/phosphite/phosphonate ABC transporter substrate-binding protein [Paenibacillus sp. CGMCC 1.16610]|uniref:Phosphate/phosphite/phosphonate ABC transporter substrate-binding protein n=2 Tax=Paenibacillus TaxID=44249 RepID=A0ABW9UB49_9BACL|nr:MULTISPECIES: phosphate/phosphite/phosphonate ABC transporter substrate-binding protein [Paenibacillus]MBA2940443.1 phosphate/phosphite/phosphonate ABC transporter substrate-binding protein [Paenibacillus sp. CGMCC 1.16610]MVQ35620.1 phosphate/phosphite/phosphonate ABC transporter substrate-binding protein [Paenibacillus anseongense]